MEKKDLKQLTVVETRNGFKAIVINKENGDGFFLLGEPGFSDISAEYYNDDLTCPFDHEMDIVKVYGPCKNVSVWRYGDPIYIRRDVKKMTIKEVSEALGYEVEIIERKGNDSSGN